MDILAGLYGFKQGDYFAGFAGSVEAGLSHLGHVRNALQTMRDINVLDLQIFNHTVYFDDGTVVYVERCFNKYTAEVIVPIARKLQEGEFYWVPGCVARYDVISGKSKDNYIPDKGLSTETVTSATGNSETESTQTSCTLSAGGLPSTASSPDGSIKRNYNIIILPGDSTATKIADMSSGLLFSRGNIPTYGSFSISCVVMLNSNIGMDYSFTEKTDELDCGYTVWNPVKPRVLTSSDGESWSASCPGSLCPLVGSSLASRFSNHYVQRTNPWPSYNGNFVSNSYSNIGFREIATVCDDEPLLISEYSPSSPYWDKVVEGDQETLEGEFQGGWEENTEIVNSSPFASYCKFKVDGAHGKASGTRVVGYTQDGMIRYATVYSFEYEYHNDGSIKNTIFTLKDYQYKLYINSTQPSLVFGSRPFPVCHTQGYMIGINYCGIFWYNGNRVLAGKVCDFEKEYSFPPIASDPLDLNTWYHVCMTYEQTNSFGEDSGKTSLYITRFGDTTTHIITGDQSIGEFINYNDWGDSLDWYSGINNTYYSPAKNSPSSVWDCSWTNSASMMIGLPRFYKRVLSKEEVTLLTKEVFNGVFVADDFEAQQLISKCFQPILV